jgi:N-acetylmuramoyl-L-alanine amidase
LERLKDFPICKKGRNTKAADLVFAAFDVKDMPILLSAGHTNNPHSDQGAVGNGYIEGVEAVKVRDAVASLLRDRGLTVIEDGADGVSDPLKKAIALAKTADTAIEFHFNAGPPTATGVEVLSKPKHKALAQSIATEMSEDAMTDAVYASEKET